MKKRNIKIVVKHVNKETNKESIQIYRFIDQDIKVKAKIKNKN